MKIQCTNCQKSLTINDKIKKGLKQLGPGRVLRLNCPNCNESIALDAGHLSTAKKQENVAVGSHISPPMPPDIKWLKEGIFEEEEIVEDIPQALILAKPGADRDHIARAFESIGYQAVFAESGNHAMARMQFDIFASVILHENFEDGAMRSSSFHQFMREMRMEKRRYIFYILVGAEYSTLYDLEALSYSANLVINSRELPELPIVLRKAIPQYEALFGNLMAEISTYTN